MRILLLIFLFFLYPINTPGQDFNEKQINISQESNIHIYGDAGVADFTCEFDLDFLQPPGTILYRSGNSTINFKNTELVLENKGFDCGNRSRNKDFHKMVRTEEYPQMKIILKEVTRQDNNKYKASVDIEIAGKVNTYTIPVETSPKPSMQIEGQFKINVRDFGLEPITKMFGLVKVDEVIDINLYLRIEE